MEFLPAAFCAYNCPMPRTAPATALAPPPAGSAHLGPLVVVLVAYAGLMGVSFSQAAYGLLLNSDRLAAQDGLRREMFYDTLVFEAVDAVIVAAALILAARPLRRAAAWSRLGTWLLSVPGFAAVIGVNFAYHALLVYLFAGDDPPEAAGADGAADGLFTRDGWRTVLTVCVQPAVVEELFFRFLLLGHLRHHLGLHASVWLSSVLFGMAHLGNVPGWPVLIGIGVTLGYARVLSGGMALPILLHFCHNFVICLAEEFGH